MTALEQRYGIPRSDVERVMQHYGVRYEEAEKGILEGRYPLPARGARVQTSSTNWMLVATGIGAVLSGIVTIWLGLRGGQES